MRAMLFVLSLLIAAVPAFTARAEEPETLLGVWSTRDDRAHIRLHRCEDERLVCGTIIWTKSGKDDRLGATILSGFAFEDGRLRGGRILDPRNGSSYRGRLELIAEDRLKVEGCVLIFCGDQQWVRVFEHTSSALALVTEDAPSEDHPAIQP